MRSVTFIVATNSCVGCNSLKIDSAIFVRNSNFLLENLMKILKNRRTCDLTYLKMISKIEKIKIIMTLTRNLQLLIAIILIYTICFGSKTIRRSVRPQNHENAVRLLSFGLYSRTRARIWLKRNSERES
jgi:hypothetical protein